MAELRTGPKVAVPLPTRNQANCLSRNVGGSGGGRGREGEGKTLRIFLNSLIKNGNLKKYTNLKEINRNSANINP